MVLKILQWKLYHLASERQPLSSSLTVASGLQVNILNPVLLVLLILIGKSNVSWLPAVEDEDSALTLQHACLFLSFLRPPPRKGDITILAAPLLSRLPKQLDHNLLLTGHFMLFYDCYYLFIFGCTESSLLQGLFSIWDEQKLLSSFSAQVSRCGDFLIAGHRLQSSVVVALGFSCPGHAGSSRTRDRTRVPCIGRILNHRFPREVCVANI